MVCEVEMLGRSLASVRRTPGLVNMRYLSRDSSSNALVERVTNMVKVKTSEEDIKWMQDLRALCNSLTEVKKMPKNHPLVPWAADVRKLTREEIRGGGHVRNNDGIVHSILTAMESADNLHGEEQKPYGHIHNYMNAFALPGADPKAIRPMAEFEMRKLLLKYYLLQTKEAGATGVMDEITETKALRLIDSFILGTSSERIAEHLALYHSPMTCAGLQDAFYVLYEPEVKILGDILNATPRFAVKRHKKPLKNFLSTYLLDELELNVKSRCVFVWVGDSWRELRSIKDDDVEPIGDLLRTRRQYFEEGEGVSKALCDSYIGKMRVADYEAKEWRTSVLRGYAFFFFICGLDTVISGL